MSDEIIFLEDESVLPPENETDDKAMPIYKAWFLAFFYPRRKSYVRIASQSDASVKKAFFWVVLVALFSSFALAEYPNWISLKHIFLTWFFGRLWHALATVIIFTVAAVLVKLITESLGETDSFENIAYVISTVFVPYSIIYFVVTKAVFWVGHSQNINLYLILAKVESAQKIANIYAFLLIILVIRAIAFTGSKRASVEENEIIDESDTHIRQKRDVGELDVYIEENESGSESGSFIVLSLQTFFFPNAKMFQRIAALEGASLKKALLWVSLPFFVRSAIVMAFSFQFLEGFIHALLTTGYLIGAFALTVKLTQKIADGVGGTCDTDRLAYVLAAIAFSSVIAEAFFILFLRFFAFFSWIGWIGILLAIYIVILYGMGVAGANKIEDTVDYWRVAISSSFIVLVSGGILLTFYACFALSRI